ncbi:MAG: aminotransferase class I/II-fold pyridoxal phosphate-dependent enzyme [Euryarchaeota archaeon]|nr:aminotransferase class I/II-fold pyridoxal phosphate-dependent enzyme [Euryarchaeota archaeon]
MKKKPGASTRCVHSVRYEPPRTVPVSVPIFASSTWDFTDEVLRAFSSGEGRAMAGKGDYIYARYGSPTTHAVEKALASLESAESGVVFSSGMAAISSAALSHLRAGDSFVSSNQLYGVTHSLFTRTLPKFDIKVQFADPTDMDGFEKALKKGAALIYVESASNPLMRVPDFGALARMSKDSGAPIIVDNTFMTPVNFRPLENGAAVSVHSATKYLGGHSDIVMGAACASEERCARVWDEMLRLGGCADPFQAFLLGRGLKTLALRVARQNDNAMAIASELEGAKGVARVHYPGLPSHPDHYIARKLFEGYGGMLSIDVKGGARAATKFMRALKWGREATSLGGVETLVSTPYNTSHTWITEKERLGLGITNGLVRVSVGIEDSADLIEDFKNALRAAR